MIAFGVRSIQLKSSVQATADILREEVFRIREPNHFFGREADLIARLGVSRATFRQAVRVLEHEQLLETRRGGTGGGLYTRHPTGEAVAHFASVYLMATGAGLRDLMFAIGPVREEAVRALAASQDSDLRAALIRYLDGHSGFLQTQDYRVIQRVLSGYHRLLALLCGNPALALYLEIVRHFTNETRWDSEFAMDEAAMLAYVGQLNTQARAIADGDTEAASASAAALSSILDGWLP